MAEISTSIITKITTLYAMTYDELKTAIIAVIKTNYNQEITAVVLQDILTEMMQTMEDEDTRVLTESKAYTDEREEVIRTDFAAADQVVLDSAKDYTDEREEIIRQDYATADQQILSQAKGYTNKREVVIRTDFTTADANTLATAKAYTNAREESIRNDYEKADSSVLASAKQYADTVKDWNYAEKRKKIWTGTQEEYDALEVKDPDTIYFTDDNDITVTPTSLIFTWEGGTKMLYIKADSGTTWSAQSSLPKGWTASPLSGTGNGTITVNVPVNASSLPLSGSITITGGDLVINIPCTQQQQIVKETIQLTIDQWNLINGNIIVDASQAVTDYLTIQGEAGGASIAPFQWTVQMLPGNASALTSVGSPVDSAQILSVNEDTASPYEGVNANYTWNNTRKTK